MLDVPKEDEEKFITYRQAARLCNRSVQALHVARNKGRLKCVKIENTRYIQIKELNNYLASRFNRENSMFNGELLYDISKGTYPAKKAAEYLQISYQHLYYHTRQGNVKCTRKGATLIYSKDDLDAFLQWSKDVAGGLCSY